MYFPFGQKKTAHKKCAAVSALLKLFLCNAVTLIESVSTSAGINELLSSGEERMALGANFNTDILLGRAGLDHITASAGNGSLAIIRMDLFLHFIHLFHT